MILWKKLTELKRMQILGILEKDCIANRQFVVYTCNNKEIDHFRLGISVSKKLGNAVLRNKIKRANRENFKVHKSHILAKDIIVIARQPAKDMTTTNTE